MPIVRHLCSALILAACCVVPLTVSAQESPNAAIGRIRQLVLHADYDAAVEAAGELLARTDLTAIQRNVTLEAMAIAEIANGSSSRATEALNQLYARDPEHRLSDPDAGPRVTSFFGRIRSNLPPPAEVSIHAEGTTPTTRQPPLVRARFLEGEDVVHEVRLAYRQGTDSRPVWVTMTPNDDGIYRARIPVRVDTNDAYETQFIVVARTPSGFVVAQHGTEAEPIQLRVPGMVPGQASPPPEQDPGTIGGEAPPSFEVGEATSQNTGPELDDEGGSTWWIWTLAAVVLVGAGVGAYFLFGPPSDGPEPGSLGTLMLE